MDYIIKPYTDYNCRNIILLYGKIFEDKDVMDSTKIKKLSELKSIFAILILGNNRVI